MNPGYFLLRTVMLPIEQIDSAIPKKGKIVDLGCGQGIIASHLAAVSSRDVIGIDSNELRLQKSSKKNLHFKKGDITRMSLGKIDGAVISDVLHHILPNNQKKLIQNVYSSLKSDGVFVIKEIDTGEFLRSKLTRLWDFLLYPKDKIYFSNAKDLEKLLKSTGFRSITITRPCRLFPGSTTLFVCKK